MNPTVEALLALQERDARVAALTAELESLPKQIAAVADDLEARTKKFDELKSRTRQIEADRIAVQRGGLDRRTAGEAQPEHLGDLVERLADGIVDGRAEPHIAPDAFDREQLRMAARHQQQEKREADVVGQPASQRMAFQMVDRNERPVACQRQRLTHGDADDHATDQAGAAGRRDAVELVEADVRLRQRLAHQPIEMVEMGARRDLGHHPPERTMLLELREHQRGADESRVGHHRRRGLVAGCLDAEHDHDANLRPISERRDGGI